MRKSNIELLRIILMFMIILLHYIGHGGVLLDSRINDFNKIVALLIRSVSIIAVNSYVIITGYFMHNKKINIKKIIELEKILIFYSWGILLLYLIVNIFSRGFSSNLDNKFILKSIAPFLGNLWWFASAYIFLYLISPAINYILKSINRTIESIIIIILIFYIGVCPIIFKLESSSTKILFITMYCIGAYIGRYKIKLNSIINLCGYVFAISIIFFLSVFMYDNSYVFNTIYRYDNIVNIIGSMFFVMYFTTLKIKNNRIINYIASSTFAVYLIHDNPYIRENLYKIINVWEVRNNTFFILHMILSSILIFGICIFIDKIRVVIFNKISYKVRRMKEDI